MTRRMEGSSLFGIPSLSPPCPLIIAYLASAPRGQPRVIASSCVVVILPAELAIHGAEQTAKPASAWDHTTASGLS